MRAYLRANRPLFPPNLHFLPLEFLSLSLSSSHEEKRRVPGPLQLSSRKDLAESSATCARIFLDSFFFLSPPPLFSKRNFPLRGNMDEFIDLDLRRVRKNLFFINLLNFIREGDLYKSYLFKTCS